MSSSLNYHLISIARSSSQSQQALHQKLSIKLSLHQPYRSHSLTLANQGL
ncbi:hypothetical protein HC931_26335 [Candidatus Gracilibacteria bacterium]|nr:hypothetical protein [Candidatus Gracilibacteria bacterium]